MSSDRLAKKRYTGSRSGPGSRRAARTPADTESWINANEETLVSAERLLRSTRVDHFGFAKSAARHGPMRLRACLVGQAKPGHRTPTPRPRYIDTRACC
jgi:hypothetical protein